MRPRIRHIAVVAKDVAAMAEFYKNAFGMKEVHRHWTNEAKGRYTIYLSDGEINLAIFAPNEVNGREEGIYHFGFQVDDVEHGYQQALAAGAQPPFRETPRDGRFAETFVLDPVGQKVDIARGWEIEIDDAYAPDPTIGVVR
jgi:catechol 2,3-dioxygenase-like lactoylglutathione lyase family enzyme